MQQELATARNLDDFFGKEGIFARLSATTIEHMREAELTDHLGYERYALRVATRATAVTVKRDVLGHWGGDGAEGATFWPSVVTDLQARGVRDIFLACVDGRTGFKVAIQAVFPKTQIQRCIIHQIRESLSYVTWKDRKDFVCDLRKIYQAPTREAAETALLQLSEVWGAKYAIAVRSWEANREDLATMFESPPDIWRLIYTTNTIKGYNWQLRKWTVPPRIGPASSTSSPSALTAASRTPP